MTDEVKPKSEKPKRAKKETPNKKIARLLSNLSSKEREKVIAEQLVKMRNAAKATFKTMIKDVKRRSSGRIK